MIFKNSQQDINIEEPDSVKVVSLKISGGADSAIVGYMLSKYVAEERPDIKIIPLTTNHPKKPYQGVFAPRIINFYKDTLPKPRPKNVVSLNYEQKNKIIENPEVETEVDDEPVTIPIEKARDNRSFLDKLTERVKDFLDNAE